LPGLTSSTLIFRGGGSTAQATLSVARSSRTSTLALIVPPPVWLKGRTTERRMWGSSVSALSAMVTPSTWSENVKVCTSAE
jgi:hypothetical protein